MHQRLRRQYVTTSFFSYLTLTNDICTYLQVENFLDLKQKQANVDESRMARWQAEVTQDQSRAVMVFTVFTVMSVTTLLDKSYRS